MRAPVKKANTKAGGQNKLTLWRRHHGYAVKNALTSLSQGRWTVLINSAILGLLLALPLALMSVTNHIEIFSDTLNDVPDATFYLQLNESVSDQSVDNLLNRLQRDTRIDHLSYHSKEDILDKVLKELSIEPSIELQTLNPFFHTVEVTPRNETDANRGLDELLNELRTDNQVAHLEMINRRNDPGQTDFLAIFQRFAHALSVIVLLSSLLICGYMVRNQIIRQQLEVEVTRYCGADDAFIRRPFLYWGAAQGCLGAMCAGVIVYICLCFLIMPTMTPAAGLMPLFYPYELAAIFITATALGLMGAWIAAKLHLRALASVDKQR